MPATASPTKSAKPTHTATKPMGRKALAELRPGQTAVVREASSDPADAAVLRAMGLRQNTRVRICRTGEPCIVSILSGPQGGCGEGCRIGLAGMLARRVVVELE